MREAGFDVPILIGGIQFEDAISEIVSYDIITTACQKSWVKALSEEAVKQGKTAQINVKVNTGMNRIGVEPEETLDFVTYVKGLPNVEIEGIFTHFATAYGEKDFVRVQYERFTAVLQELEDAGIHIPYVHCSSTGGVQNDLYHRP